MFPPENKSILQLDPEEHDVEEFHTRAGRWLLKIATPAILKKTPRKPLGPTSYLDGLRGFAAFLVYWQHHQVWARVSIYANNIFENSWGYEGRYYFVCLPGIRTFFTGGHLAVAVFFVISGHVLSTKPLMYIQTQNYAKLEENLASALFRRWIRLHIPAIATSFLYFTCWHIFGISTAYPDHRATWLEEFDEWYKQYFRTFSFAFPPTDATELWFTYNFHLWSIPVEFRGSVIIYTAQLAFSRFTHAKRLICELVLIFYFLYLTDGWFCAMFMSGMLICDLDLLAKSNNLPPILNRFIPYKQQIIYTLFAIASYFAGVPSSNGFSLDVIQNSPGWYYLSFIRSRSLDDYKWFFLFWAATFIVACIPHMPLLKAFFETRFNQYLGRISFALYLVHGPILWTLSDKLYAAVGWSRDWNNEGIKEWENLWPLSKEGPLGFELSFWVPHLVILPVTLWLAEVGTALFDKPSVTFSHWLYRSALPAKR
ncbi:acyltransferase 3 [Amylocarpus encephaloides]|uniref:Acyltransferase 3 n=1 Tax=Amylocarpus encephaloides TaxID=45428 RepID=A0A9P8C927_9HELO|nr:acyltransferase 3 [Amylocarpus encephaloides]